MLLVGICFNLLWHINLVKINLLKLFLKYIKGQLNIIYEGGEQVQYSGSITLPVDEEGKIHAIVSCGDAPKFYVDPETGKLWEKKEEGKEYNETYSLSDVDYDNE